VRIPIFNRNQGNIATAKADAERAKREVERVKLVLRERAASVVQNYTFSQTAVERYKNQMIPRAQKAYEMYAKKYQEMAASYPQVLIANPDAARSRLHHCSGELRYEFTFSAVLFAHRRPGSAFAARRNRPTGA